LNSAMNQPYSKDVSCTLYFSVIESIYVQDDSHTELKYKLLMRLTKKMAEDSAYYNKLGKLYNKRSKVIHGTEKGDVFNDEEHDFLRSLATSAVLSYIKKPEDYSTKALDELLMSST